MVKKNRERIRREKEEFIRKAKEEMKKESQRLYRLSYDYSHKDVKDLMSGWVKMRGPLKNWYLRWLVLRPGKLIYYKDEVVSLGMLGLILFRPKTVKGSSSFVTVSSLNVKRRRAAFVSKFIIHQKETFIVHEDSKASHCLQVSSL